MQYIFKFISCHWSLSVLPEHIRKPQNVHHTVPKNPTSLRDIFAKRKNFQ